jgi:hypothetical protein
MEISPPVLIQLLPVHAEQILPFKEHLPVPDLPVFREQTHDRQRSHTFAAAGFSYDPQRFAPVHMK